MDALWIMLKNVIVFVLLAMPGFILVKTKIVKTTESGILSKLMTYVGMPFLILSSTLNVTFSGEFIGKILLVGIAGIAFVVGTFFISVLFLNKKDEEQKQKMARFCMVFANNGFLGLPLAEAVFGNSPVVTYMVVLNILNNVLMFTLGVYLISGDKGAINPKKALLSPVLIAFIMGIVLNLLNVKSVLPELVTYSNHLKGIVTPLSMTVLGIKMAEIKLGDLFKERSMYAVSSVKLLVFPVISVALMFLLKIVPAFAVNTEMVVAFFMAFAMPTAGMASTFADQYNGDTKNSVAYTLGSTLLSVISIPVLYWVLCLWI